MANTEARRNGKENPAARARVNGARAAVTAARVAAARATVPSAAPEADSRGKASAP